MKYIRSKKLAELFGVNQSTIWRWRKRKDFPQAIYLGPNTVVWSLKSVETWMQSNNKEKV